MKFASTRGKSPAVLASEALCAGLAPDGGLYVPQSLPALSPADFRHAQGLAAVAAVTLAPFFEDDPLHREVARLCAEAYAAPAALKPLRDTAGPLSLLELFHGPTAAFKDYGARFLAACHAILAERAPDTIVVATSGDTGGAVAAAYHRRPGVEVLLLYPAEGVSPLQERQLNAFGDNVRTLQVEGSFDDCQALARALLSDAELARRRRLGSANSLNIGRLLPQVAWFAWASLRIWNAEGRAAHFVVPAGNLGHGTACLLARRMGLPIGEVLLAHNANRPLPDYLASGNWEPRPRVATLASAMDVGAPSNFERLGHWYPDVEALRAAVQAASASDADIRAAIRGTHARHGLAVCPHTAAALHALGQLPAAAREDAHWVVVATAHPAKFAEVVNPLVGTEPVLPPALARLDGITARGARVAPDPQAVKEMLGWQ